MVTPKEDDRHLMRLVAEVTLWQEMLEQLVGRQRHASDPDAHLTVKNENWRRRAEIARRHATEHTDPSTKQALLELAESYDLLVQRDERAQKDRQLG
jgi:hypothetical protein